MAEMFEQVRSDLGPMAVLLSVRRLEADGAGERWLEATAAVEDAVNALAAPMVPHKNAVATQPEPEKPVAPEPKDNTRRKPSKGRKALAMLLKRAGGRAKEARAESNTIRLPLPNRPWESESGATSGRHWTDDMEQTAGKTQMRPHWTEDEFYANEPENAGEEEAPDQVSLSPAATAKNATVELRQAQPSAAKKAPALGAARWRALLAEAAFRSQQRAGQTTAASVDGVGIHILLGPKGSGKSTTAAKLAILLQREFGRPAGLISMDLRRPGGVSLLAAYAGFLGLPLTYAETGRDLLNVIQCWGARGPLVVDTEGFNADDVEALAEAVRTFGPLHGQAELHWVLNAAAHPDVIHAGTMACRELRHGRLLPTRADEDVCARETLRWARVSGVPLSFLGVGPRTPEDLARPTEVEWRELAGEVAYSEEAPTAMPGSGDARETQTEKRKIVCA